MVYIGKAEKLVPSVQWMCKGSLALCREWIGRGYSKK